ncbi:hypothetical protein [Streptomyces panaciradicis]|uniref:hypothetical protein n=1 Tax=Streptomyces panaciradicis TaxID=1470261 RepID=UPI00201CD973|nr:hypothetical protein [Streptomyces panaciradicis]MCL6667985.1 hypothetical protein [Streptomyces panaciradicis]
MDTLRKIMDLRQDPAPQASNPRQEAMSHIHTVLNQGGAQGVTVGHAVAAAIEGIHYGAGEHGARDVHTVFMDPALTDAYLTPLNSEHAPEAHRQIAEAEFNYWDQQNRQNPTRGTQVAVSFDVDHRVQLQSNIGRLVQAGQSFTQHLANEQPFSTGNENPVALYAGMLPPGSSQPRASQQGSASTQPATTPAPAPKGRRR